MGNRNFIFVVLLMGTTSFATLPETVRRKAPQTGPSTTVPKADPNISIRGGARSGGAVVPGVTLTQPKAEASHQVQGASTEAAKVNTGGNGFQLPGAKKPMTTAEKIEAARKSDGNKTGGSDTAKARQVETDGNLTSLKAGEKLPGKLKDLDTDVQEDIKQQILDATSKIEDQAERLKTQGIMLAVMIKTNGKANLAEVGKNLEAIGEALKSGELAEMLKNLDPKVTPEEAGRLILTLHMDAPENLTHVVKLLGTTLKDDKAAAEGFGNILITLKNAVAPKGSPESKQELARNGLDGLYAKHGVDKEDMKKQCNL